MLYRENKKTMTDEIDELNRIRQHIKLKKKQPIYRELIDIFECAVDGMRVVDKDFNVIRVNNTFLKMVGLEENQIIGQKCYNLFKGIQCHTSDCPHKRILEGEEHVEYEADRERTDGSLVPCIVTVKPFRGACGEIKGTIGNFRDITDKKQTEKALRKSEEHYRMIFENSPLGIVHFDQNGVITSCNDTLIQIMEASREKLLGFNMLRDIKDIKMSSALQAALNGDVGFYEGNYRSVSGNKSVALRATFNGITSENGSILGGVGIYEDVSERIKAEEALRKSELYNSLILNGINEVVSLYEVIDESHFRFLKVNNNLLNSLDLEEGAVIGRLIEEVLPADTAKRWVKNNRKVVKSRKPMFFEESYGDLGTFEVKLFPLLNDEGKCTHLIANTNDITEQKKIEQQQLKMEKLESLGLLAGGIAHDFNNILTAIIGNASLIKMKIDNMSNSEDKDKLLNWLFELELASHQAKDLTQQLLTFAKGGDPILQTVAIGNLLTETAEFALTGSNVRCNYAISEDLWSAEIDGGQISQVIHNLVINATHAMQGGGVITISAHNFFKNPNDNMPLKNGPYVKISVQDHGHGIPQEHIDKIFDPYFSTKQMGSGLGLTTTFSVVRKHKGFITVDSEVGLGTTFNIYLPASQKRIKDKPIGMQITLTGKGKVLVMDDEKLVRQVLSEMLRVLGYEAICVKDGFEAIEAYIKAMGTTTPFDVVIMDLTIPGGLGGKDTIKRLADIDPKVKAVVSSGYSNNPVMANYKKYGFMDVVAKPYSIEKLGAILENVIKGFHKKTQIKTIS